VSNRPTMEELSAYLEGALKTEDHERVRQAITTEPALQAELQSLEASLQFLRDNAPLEAPPNLSEAVLSALADEAIPHRAQWARATTGAIVLAAAAAMLFVTLPTMNVAEEGAATNLAPTEYTAASKGAPAAANSVSPDAALRAEVDEEAEEEEAERRPSPKLKAAAAQAPPPPVNENDKLAKKEQAPLIDLLAQEDDDTPQLGGIGDLVGSSGFGRGQTGAGGLGAAAKPSGGVVSAQIPGSLSNTAAEGSAEYKDSSRRLGATEGPTVSNRTPTIAGELDQARVDEVLTKYASGIRTCYLKALQAEPTLRGELAISFTITTDGTVSTASVKTSTLGNAPFEACLVQRFMNMAFPQPQGGGNVTVSYPFTFSPG
jgi:TonB family protein